MEYGSSIRNEENKVAYGNLAYKYDYIYEKRPQQQKKKQTNSTRVHNKKKNKKISYPAKLASVFILSASAVFMITQFVEVNETLGVLESKQTDYAFEESVTSQKSFELEQSVDLSKIEQEATTRLGMKRPEAHQIIYVDVKQNDVTEKTSGEVEGFGNRVAEFFNNAISNIVSFFSI